MNRKHFLSAISLVPFSYGLGNTVIPTKPVIQEKPGSLDGVLVKEFVIAGHSDLEKLKQMLDFTPGLLNSSWDWGAGDFETALEGAGHMGRTDIAQYLISKGGRINLFCAAMLGNLEMVKSTLSTYPSLKDSKGPHGLKLKHHAEKGGENAREVLEYLIRIDAS